MGLSVEERPLHIDEIVEAYKKGILHESFGTGTAATISMIKELRYKDFFMHFNIDNCIYAPAIKKQMSAIKEGKIADVYNWMYKI